MCVVRSVTGEALECINEAVPRQCSPEDLALLEGSPVKTGLHQYYIATEYICVQQFDGNV